MNSIDARQFFTSEAIENPYPLYAKMRALSPVCAIGDTGAFLVGTKAAVEEALKRHEDFSANLKAMLVCGEDDKPYIFNLAQAGNANDVIATADEPDHAVHRRLMMPPLKASRISELEGQLREFAAERVAGLKRAGGGDICAMLSEPLPAYVVIRLLDLGDDSLQAVQRWAMMGGDFLAGRLSEAEMTHIFTETLALHDYLSRHFDALAERALEDRGNSLTATLLGGVEEGLISREQAIGILIILFGAAGESTASLLGCAIRRLAINTPLQQQLRETPALIAPFVEEVLRLESPFKFHYRHVKKDTTLCGTSLKAGNILLLSWASANRDPAVWEEPDTLRLDRVRGDRHFGFGYGIHFCIGAPLARLEVCVAIEELLQQTSTFELDPQSPPVFAPSIFVRRLQQLRLRIS
ncbi:MAG: cytochrome P450 [Pseudomonadales bacterium]|nr:cytochrome P450 [Pseudomonadales bacterium]